MKFDQTAHKCAIIIDADLPNGLAINAASIISISFGKIIDNIVGPDLKSKDGTHYPGVICSPLPVLVATNDYVQELNILTGDNQNILKIPFSSLAQSCKNYDEYDYRIATTNSENIKLVAIGIIGPKKLIQKATGNLSLFS